jgi:SSS family transporter
MVYPNGGGLNHTSVATGLSVRIKGSGELDWMIEHGFLIVLFVAYTVLLMRNASAGNTASDDVRGYFVGGRSLGGVAIGFSYFATFASTNSYVGHAGQSYASGLPWLTLAVLIVLFTWVSWKYVAPRLYAFVSSHDALTLPDFLALRFPHPAGREFVRVTSGVVIVLAAVLYLVAIFKGAGNVFQEFLDISYTLAVGITLVIVVVYTALGGFVSVVRTDVIQGVFMVIGAVLIFGFVTDAAGGVTRLPELKENPETAPLFEFGAIVPAAVIIGMSLSGALKLLVDPRQLSRFYGLRSEAEIRTGVWVAVIGIMLIQFCLFPVGVYAHFLLDGVTDTDRIVPTLINDPTIFPGPVADFLVVALISAAMSSMDSVLLVAASVLQRDIVQVVWPKLPAVRFTQFAVVGFALVSAGLALNPPGGIVEMTLFSGSVYAVCFFPAVLLGLWWGRGNWFAVMASMVGGMTVLLLWMLAGFGDVLHELFPSLAMALLVYIVLSLKTPVDPRIGASSPVANGSVPLP